MDEPLSTLPRAPGAALGAAHLAWGVAIVLGLIYAAQQMPGPSTPLHARLGLATFFVGLAWLAATAWRHVERGWQLRRAKNQRSGYLWLEVITNLAVGSVMVAALARQSQSRVLALGLDRLVSAGLTVAVLSLVLLGCNWLTKKSPGGSISKVELSLAFGFAALVGLMECSS